MAAIVLAYAAATVLMLQSTNRYEWMADEGVHPLPLDRDSPRRVLMLATAVALFDSLALLLAQAWRERRRLRNFLCWFALPPLAYAVWRMAGAILEQS